MEITSYKLNGKEQKRIKLCSFDEAQRANKKKIRDIKLDKMINELREILWIMGGLIEEYKNMYHMTELWERKSTLNFDFYNWNKLKKVNGKLTRYYNDLITVKLDLEKRKNEERKH